MDVPVLSPLLGKTAPGDLSGGRFHAVWDRVWELSVARGLRPLET
jgi:hypothetical protein